MISIRIAMGRGVKTHQPISIFCSLAGQKNCNIQVFLCTNEPRDICLVSYVKTLKQKNKNKPKQNSKETKRNSAYGSALL